MKKLLSFCVLSGLLTLSSNVFAQSDEIKEAVNKREKLGFCSFYGIGKASSKELFISDEILFGAQDQSYSAYVSVKVDELGLISGMIQVMDRETGRPAMTNYFQKTSRGLEFNLNRKDSELITLSCVLFAGQK